MKISVKADGFSNFDGDEYIIDLDRPMDDYAPGDLICYVVPWGVCDKFPLTLELAIASDGHLKFRSWRWNGQGNSYLHTDEIATPDPEKPWKSPFTATPEQADTIGGLFSGRITFEGLRLNPGRTLQRIAPIDLEREEALIGKKIYLA